MSAPVRVLLVEDSPTDAALITRALGAGPGAFEVTRAETAGDVAAALAARAWDAVICDWVLPGFSALECLAQVRASARGVPVVVVSGVVGEESAVAAMRAGASDFLQKERLLRLVPALERSLRDARRRADQELQEARYRAMIEKGQGAILLSSFDGVVRYANPAAEAVLGAPAAALVGQRFLDLVHPDEWAAFVPKMVAVRAQAGHAHTEQRIRRADGTYFWSELTANNLLDEPAVGAIVVSLRDISDRHRAVAALAASEVRLARLSETGLVGIVVFDVNGGVRDVNDAYLAMLGYTRADVTASGFRWTGLSAPERAADTRAMLTRVLEEGVTPPWETVLVARSGARVPVLARAALLEYPVGIAFVIDRTERTRAQATLHEREDHLRQAQKMEAVGRLAGGVAHDFNNALSVVLSAADMLLEDLAAADPHREAVVEIFRAGERAADLTRQLLLFSRRQVVAPRVLDLGALVTEMSKLLRRALGVTITLELCLAPDLGRVHADPSSLEQVLMNLVVNARDAMPAGGRLTVETRDVDLDAVAAARVGAPEPGPYVALAVTDTGSGMDAATRARVFEPFFTTKPRDKGTGLGLSTVLGIVQQAGGGLRLETAPGRGSTFEVYFPRVDGALAPAGLGAPAFARGSESVLLVEDDPLVRGVARAVLRRSGYTVLEVETPQDALAVCRESARGIDLLVTDVVMPQMSGPELAAAATALRPGLKVLCMSGYTDDDVVRRGISSSDIAFLQKPFTPASLAHKVRDVLDGTATRGPRTEGGS